MEICMYTHARTHTRVLSIIAVAYPVSRSISNALQSDKLLNERVSAPHSQRQLSLSMSCCSSARAFAFEKLRAQLRCIPTYGSTQVRGFDGICRWERWDVNFVFAGDLYLIKRDLFDECILFGFQENYKITTKYFYDFSNNFQGKKSTSWILLQELIK